MDLLWTVSKYSQDTCGRDGPLPTTGIFPFGTLGRVRVINELPLAHVTKAIPDNGQALGITFTQGQQVFVWICDCIPISKLNNMVFSIIDEAVPPVLTGRHQAIDVVERCRKNGTVSHRNQCIASDGFAITTKRLTLSKVHQLDELQNVQAAARLAQKVGRRLRGFSLIKKGVLVHTVSTVSCNPSLECCFKVRLIDGNLSGLLNKSLSVGHHNIGLGLKTQQVSRVELHHRTVAKKPAACKHTAGDFQSIPARDWPWPEIGGREPQSGNAYAMM